MGMEITQFILGILSSSCLIVWAIWNLLEMCKCGKKNTEESAVSAALIAYLYDRAKGGDDEAFRILQNISNSRS